MQTVDILWINKSKSCAWIILQKDINTDESSAFIDQVAQESATTTDLRDQLLNILLVGRDSTACCLSWTMYVIQPFFKHFCGHSYFTIGVFEFVIPEKSLGNYLSNGKRGASDPGTNQKNAVSKFCHKIKYEAQLFIVYLLK